MNSHLAWQGVRMRRVSVGADPDAPPRAVRIPAGWDDAAAAALAALAPGEAPVTIVDAAERWIGPIAARAVAMGVALPLANRLHRMLLLRQGAPGWSVWHGETGGAPEFVLNLAAFSDEGGFDLPAFAEAVTTAVWALSLADPSAERLRIGVSDLATLLAATGHDYDSAQSRTLARGIAAVLRATADRASASVARHTGMAAGRASSVAATDAGLPGAVPAGTALRHVATTALQAPGPAEALLGIRHGGIAPGFSPLSADGTLSAASRARLTALGLTAEAALAALYAGRDLLPVADIAAHAAMHDALAPFIHAMPARPEPAHPEPARATPAAVPRGPAFEELPARRRGYTQRAAIGGHRVFLRTGEYPDGRLGELAVTLPREPAAVRALMDALATAIGVGLQHGVGLRPYVDALANARFAPSGAVEGDPAVAEAASPLDYVMRTLAASYLGLTDLPADSPAPGADAAPDGDATLQLPLDLPQTPAARRRGLRLVS